MVEQIVVLDGRDAPLADLCGEDKTASELVEAQNKLAMQLVLYLGCVRDDRLYVASARRVELNIVYSTGEVVEPATEVIFNVKREVGTERKPTEIIQQLQAAHEDGQLGEVLGVNRDNIREFKLTLPKERVRDTPTLVQLRAEAEEQRDIFQERPTRQPNLAGPARVPCLPAVVPSRWRAGCG